MYNRALFQCSQTLTMPIYEYLCSECDHKFDQLQKISDAPLKICPECSKESLIKLISAPSFRLSGSGWYETDFKSDSDKKKNLAGDAGKPASQKTDTAKSKPEKTTPTATKPKSTDAKG